MPPIHPPDQEESGLLFPTIEGRCAPTPRLCGPPGPAWVLHRKPSRCCEQGKARDAWARSGGRSGPASQAALTARAQ